MDVVLFVLFFALIALTFVLSSRKPKPKPLDYEQVLKGSNPRIQPPNGGVLAPWQQASPYFENEIDWGAIDAAAWATEFGELHD